MEEPAVAKMEGAEETEEEAAAAVPAAHPFTGITADGRHVANSVGALHIVKREAEADADADAYYGYGGYYGTRAYGYAPYGYAGYRGYGYRGYGLGYGRFG